MLKKELHEFLIANGGEFLKDKSAYGSSGKWDNVYHFDNLDIYYDNKSVFAFNKEITYIKPIMRAQTQSNIIATDLTLDILKQTLINAGIEIKKSVEKFPDFMIAIQIDNLKQMGHDTSEIEKKYLKESKQMKTAKWQIDDGNVIEVVYNFEEVLADKLTDKLTFLLTNPVFITHRPWQYNDKESDFTILLKDGTVKHAKYIKPDEFKVGDVVDVDGVITVIEKIYKTKDLPYSLEGFGGYWEAHQFKLIASFEEWCKDNLSEDFKIEFINTPTYRHYDLLYKHIYQQIPCDWKLIHQIKVTQAIIDALKGNKS